MLQAQQGLSCEPKKKIFWGLVCVRGFAPKGGFFAVSASRNLVLRIVSANFPVSSDHASQRVKTRVGAAHCTGSAHWLPAGKD